MSGCPGPGRAKTYAAYRSKCKPDKIKVVEKDDYELVLDVCGVYEDWEWHGFDGWQYVGLSASQPVKTEAPVADADGDTIPDASDACPQVAGIANADPKLNGCPAGPADADGDTVVDAADACPQQPGVPNGDPKKNGCPVDTDGDGVADSADACASVPGVASAEPNKNGCPADADGDGVADGVDACPSVKGAANADARISGCAVTGEVVLTRDAVVLLKPIAFAAGSARLTAPSKPVVASLAKALNDNPDTKVEVQAHTAGTRPANVEKRLSQAQADAVKQELARQGIDPSRVTATGYGSGTPGADGPSERIEVALTK
ncbi:MAG: OmpA family protein [Myxococcota bacterium]